MARRKERVTQRQRRDGMAQPQPRRWRRAAAALLRTIARENAVAPRRRQLAGVKYGHLLQRGQHRHVRAAGGADKRRRHEQRVHRPVLQAQNRHYDCWHRGGTLQGKERKGKEREGRKGKERKGKERKGRKERKGKERKGKERKGKARQGNVLLHDHPVRHQDSRKRADSPCRHCSAPHALEEGRCH